MQSFDVREEGYYCSQLEPLRRTVSQAHRLAGFQMYGEAEGAKAIKFTASVKPSGVQYKKEGYEMMYSSQVGETWNNP